LTRGSQGGGGAALDRAQRRAGASGDLALREPPKICEHENLAMGSGEPGESAYHVERPQGLLRAVTLP